MSSRKFVIAAGAIILAGASAFAGSSVKFGNASTAWYKTTGGTCKELASGFVSGRLTTGGSGVIAQIKSQASGTLFTLFASNGCTKHEQFHP